MQNFWSKTFGAFGIFVNFEDFEGYIARVFSFRCNPVKFAKSRQLAFLESMGSKEMDL